MTGAPRRIDDWVLDEIRSRTTLSALIGRDVALKRKGREHSGLCPFHNEKTGSFTVSDQKGFFHCFGCGAHGDCIVYVMRRHGLDFRQAAAELGRACGLDIGDVAARTAEQASAHQARLEALAAERAAMERLAEEERLDDLAAVRRQWSERHSPDGSVVEAYLRRRAIDPSRLPRFTLADGKPAQSPNGWPLMLAFHPALYHSDSDMRLPGMIAAIVEPGPRRLIGLHRTFLKADGSDKVEQSAKKIRGQVTGGCILLGPPARDMCAAEGIETTLSVMQSLQLPGIATVSLGNLAGGGDESAQQRAPWHPRRRRKDGRPIRLPTTVPDMQRPGFVPPPAVARLLFAEDNDNGDAEAADALMRRAANRFARLGLSYTPFRAPAGADWQDVAQHHARAREAVVA